MELGAVGACQELLADVEEEPHGEPHGEPMDTPWRPPFAFVVAGTLMP